MNTETKEVTRDQKLKAIWSTTHRDFRGTLRDNAGKVIKTVLVNRAGEGTCLIDLSDLTDSEIESRYAYAVNKKARDQANKAEKRNF